MAAECGQQRRSYCKDVRELEDKDRKRREKEAVVRGEQTRQIGSPETRPGGRRGADMGEVVKQKSKWDVVVCLFFGGVPLVCVSLVCLWCPDVSARLAGHSTWTLMASAEHPRRSRQAARSRRQLLRKMGNKI